MDSCKSTLKLTLKLTFTWDGVALGVSNQDKIPEELLASPEEIRMRERQRLYWKLRREAQRKAEREMGKQPDVLSGLDKKVGVMVSISPAAVEDIRKYFQKLNLPSTPSFKSLSETSEWEVS